MRKQNNKPAPKKPQMTKDMLHGCLFFTANSLARTISRMAEAHFGKSGMSASHAFLLTLAVQSPGITQKELAQSLNLSQSTVSRFVDKLIHQGLVEKKSEGKNAFIFPTKAGKKQQGEIAVLWHEFHKQYSQILGKNNADTLSVKLNQTCIKLEENF